MSYRFKTDESVGAAAARIAHEQIDSAIHELGDETIDREKAVHQARKHCKKLRAMMSLLRPGMPDAYDAANKLFRDLAKQLSAVRDADVLIRTLDQVTDDADAQRFAEFRQALVDRRELIVKQLLDRKQRDQAVLDSLAAAHDRANGWPLERADADDVRDGLEKTYKRARHAMRVAYREPTPESFHELRKRVKYHWYHCRLLQDLSDANIKKRRKRMKKLAELLGDDHDLAVLDEAARAEASHFRTTADTQELCSRIGAASRKLRKKAKPLGRDLFRRKPKKVVKAWLG